MAASISNWQNMGSEDRVVRGALGALLITHSIRRPSFFRTWEAVLGGILLVYGATGIDPLLSLLGVTTRRGEENNILNVAKQALPGQGIHPRTTEQSVPLKSLRRRVEEGVTLKRSLAVQALF